MSAYNGTTRPGAALDPGAVLALLDAVSTVLVQAEAVVIADADVRTAAATLAEQITASLHPSGGSRQATEHARLIHKVTCERRCRR